MKFINPQTEPISVHRSFLIYGEPKAGKTSLALSVAELGKTLFLATERDGWQDAYNNLSPKAQKNLEVVEVEKLEDLRNLPAEIKKRSDIKAVVVDSFTALMGFIEEQIKNMGGKAVVTGLTRKLALNSYGDLANLTIEFLRATKDTGKHLVLTAGMDKEQNEGSEGVSSRRFPLLTGNKAANILPYEVRAIGFLRAINGKRELWFESSPQWMAGTNYDSLTKARMVEQPSFLKIFSLFPVLKKPKNEPNPTTTEPSKVESSSNSETTTPVTE